MKDSKHESQTDYRVETWAPVGLTAAAMERCTTIVIEGEAITDPESVRKWLPKSVVLAVVRKCEEIVAVGAIKPARPPYARQVAAASEHTFADNWPELGYVARDPVHRNNKFSPRIVAALLERYGRGPIWATTSSATIKAALTDAGFSNHGKEWGKPRQNDCHSFCDGPQSTAACAGPQLRGACSAAGKSSSVAETDAEHES